MKKQKILVLDTDIWTLHFFGHERVTKQYEAAEGVIAITIITWIEVLSGRFDSILKAENREKLKLAMDRLNEFKTALDEKRHLILPIDNFAANEFDKLRKLKKIGPADLLIASIVLGHQMNQARTLVTRNLKHFKQIPRLKLENWAD